MHSRRHIINNNYLDSFNFFFLKYFFREKKEGK